MIYDSGGSSSLSWNLHQVRRLAWLLRDRISADAWRILNHFDQQFSRRRRPSPCASAAALGSA